MNQFTIYFALVLAMATLLLGSIFAFNSPVGVLILIIGILTGIKLQDPDL